MSAKNHARHRTWQKRAGAVDPIEDPKVLDALRPILLREQTQNHPKSL
jgi:hypothetical protein